MTGLGAPPSGTDPAAVRGSAAAETGELEGGLGPSALSAPPSWISRASESEPSKLLLCATYTVGGILLEQ